jgi:hypothetical protein
MIPGWGHRFNVAKKWKNVLNDPYLISQSGYSKRSNYISIMRNKYKKKGSRK